MKIFMCMARPILLLLLLLLLVLSRSASCLIATFSRHAFYSPKSSHPKHKVKCYKSLDLDIHHKVYHDVSVSKSKLCANNNKYSEVSYHDVEPMNNNGTILLLPLTTNASNTKNNDTTTTSPVLKNFNNNNIINTDLISMAPAFEITYFYLQNTLNLTEDTMWKLTFQHGFILGLSVQNIKGKLMFLKRALKLSDDDMSAIISRLPALLSLTPKNIQPKITFLRQTLGIHTLELRNIVLRYPSILTYSISNADQKIQFFTEYLNCTTTQTRRLLIEHPEIITYSSTNVNSKMNFFLKEFLGSSIENASINDILIMRRVILSNPIVLGFSLGKNLYPKITFWREMLQVKEQPPKHLLSILQKFPQFLNYNIELIQNIFDYSVNELGLSVLEFRIMLLKSPRTITHSLTKFKSLVGYLTNELDLDYGTHLKRVLLQAPQLLSLSDKSLRTKVQFLSSFVAGDNSNDDDDDVNNEILKKIIVGMPTLLLCSIEKNLKPKIEYFLQKELLDGNHEKLIEMVTVQPTLLGYSLEKRIKPRMKKLLEINEDPRRITVAITLLDDKFQEWIVSEQRHDVNKRGRKKSTAARYLKKEVDKNDSSSKDQAINKDDNNTDKRIIVWTRPRKLLQ